MKMIFVSLLVIFTYIPVLFAAPMSKDDAEAKILKYINENDGSGNYHFSFETSNGISRDETGTLVNPGQPDAHIEVQGTVSYLGPDGELISVRYSADENGYHILPADGVSLVPELAQGVPPAVVASLLGG